MGGGEETIFLDFATWMKLYSLHANIEWKLAHKWVMTWFSKTRKGPSCHITFRKYQKRCMKITSEVQVSNRTKTKNIHFWDFFETNRSAEGKPQKKCQNVLADSEPWIKYGDFGTWVSRCSKWNCGVIICSHIFLLMCW